MWQKLQSLYDRISFLGVTTDLPAVERGRVVILNRAMLIIIGLQILLYLDQIIRDGDLLVIPIIVVLLSGLPVFLMHYHRRFVLARFYINLFYPLVLFWVITRFGEALRVDYAFFIFFITAIVFHDKTRVKIALCLYILCLFILSEYYLSHYESIKAYEVDAIDPIMVFVAAGACILIVISALFNENQTYRLKMENLLSSMEKKNADLTQAYGEIERFTRITSHDLKTPLRTINSFVGLMGRDLSQSNYDNLEEYFSYVHEGTAKLDALISGILQYSRIDHLEHIEEEWVDLNAIVADLFELIKEDTHRKVVLTADELPLIRSKAFYWNTVLEQLIRNGIMYNVAEEPTILVRHTFDREQLCLHISDNGIGIEHQYYQQIFEVFKRLHHDQHYPGTGIGLAVCKKIAAKMNGRISLTSEPGKGSTFTVCVPWLSTKLKHRPSKVLV